MEFETKYYEVIQMDVWL